MAANRFTSSKVNWKAIIDRFPAEEESQIAKLMKLKKNHENYVRRLVALPEKAPAIDWNAYKSKLPNAAFVDAIKQKYEAIKIPYPKSNVDDLINAKEKEVAEEVARVKKENAVYVSEIEKKIAEADSRLPIEQMTHQEFAQAFPGEGFSVEYPTPYPHTDAETNREWRIYIAAKEKGLPAERPRG